MRVVGYLRVSTERQAEEGLGLEVQEAKIWEWASAEGHELVAVLSDEGVSGAKELDHRPGLSDAMGLLREGSAQGIVVYRLDRLARDLIVQEQLLNEVRRMGGVTYSTSSAESGYLTDDPDDPSRRFIRQVLGAVSEYERSMITLRLRSGRRRKADRGGYAFGAPRYGYRAEAKELAVHDDEQAAVARICALSAAGVSLRRMGTILIAEGHRPKRGTRWHPESLRRIIARSHPSGDR